MPWNESRGACGGTEMRVCWFANQERKLLLISVWALHYHNPSSHPDKAVKRREINYL